MDRLFTTRVRIPDLARAALLLCLLFQLAGCAMPRLVVEDDPLTPLEHLNLGLSYEQNKEYEAAEKEYHKAAKFTELGYLYLGNLKYTLGDKSEAGRFYEKVLDKNPDNPDALNNFAWLDYEEGRNLVEAERMAKRAVELVPDNPDYQDTLAKIRVARQKE